MESKLNLGYRLSFNCHGSIIICESVYLYLSLNPFPKYKGRSDENSRANMVTNIL